MAVIRITSKCNMSCEHCCFACTKNKGEHMPRGMALAAVSEMLDYDQMVTISGGEPTIHPNFFEILDTALNHRWVENVFVVTNGKAKTKAIKLYNKWAEYREYEDDYKFSINLSQDDWHEPIDPEVVQLYKSFSSGSYYGRKGELIRSVTKILPHGSALENNVHTEDEGCACDDLCIQPNGDITLCGCLDAPVIGHVDNMEEAFNIHRETFEDWDGEKCHKAAELAEV